SGALASRFSRLASEPGIHNPQGVWWMRRCRKGRTRAKAQMTDLSAQVHALRNWLLDGALPLWWELGADRDRGGFHEAIDLDGTPVAHPHRARNIGAQHSSYCDAR